MCSKGKLTHLIGKIRVVDDQVKEHLRLEMLSRIDQLTGVYRKEAFQFLAKNALSENLAEESVLFFIDLDNFKEFNDRLGHIQGDEALRATARIIAAKFPLTPCPYTKGGRMMTNSMPVSAEMALSPASASAFEMP